MNSIENVSFIIPIYNDNAYIEKTVLDLVVAIKFAEIKSYEILIVDDGSSTPIESEILNKINNLKILRQENQGRLRARLNGVNYSQFSQIVLLDSRVSIDRMSLGKLHGHVTHNLEELDMVISCIEFPKNTNLIGLFWDSVARFVWHKYYENNQDVYLNSDNFDSYPKGTTFLYVKRDVFLKAHSKLSSEELLSRDINDDTLLIRGIVDEFQVLLCKDFKATYFPRTKFVRFLKHSFHRGKVAKDGYFADGTSGRRSLILLGILFTILIVTTILSPTIAVILIVLCIACAEAITLRRLPLRNWISLNFMILPFLISYSAGFFKKLVFAKD